MSRIGKAPVKIPSSVNVTVKPDTVLVKGPKGELTVQLPGDIKVTLADGAAMVEIAGTVRDVHALHGVVRAHLQNAVTGVTEGWSKSLELVGVGYRATLSGANLQLAVGFSHPVVMTPPPGITFQIVEGKIVVSGIDKQLVGETSATIRAVRKPEPYKGKGIRYVGEHVRKKAGKAAKAIGGAPGAK